MALPDQSESALDRLVKAGDRLADMLSRSPGIDIMRSGALDDWKDAKRRAQHPYAAHLRDAMENDHRG